MKIEKYRLYKSAPNSYGVCVFEFFFKQDWCNQFFPRNHSTFSAITSFTILLLITMISIIGKKTFYTKIGLYNNGKLYCRVFSKFVPSRYAEVFDPIQIWNQNTIEYLICYQII